MDFNKSKLRFKDSCQLSTFFEKSYSNSACYFWYSKRLNFKIHTVDIASNFNKLKIILIRITS